MIKNSVLYSVMMVVLISCTHVYKEYDKESFPTYTWKSGQGIVFKPVIEDVSKSYSLTLGIRHLYGFQLNSIPVTVRMISPSGKESTADYDFRTRNSENEYLAKCGGDLCDLETVVEENLKFGEAGTYTYVVTHQVQADQIPGVMEFGLIIDAKD
ncbi:MAG TPA: hypothetical protein VGK59_02600 [Ohtaekwangia sp.]